MFFRKILMGGIPLFSLGILGFRQRFKIAYKVQIKTILPHSMTEAEYKERKKAFIQDKPVSNTLNEFTENGKIVKTEYRFEGDYSLWTMWFRSKQEYLNYRKNSVMISSIDYKTHKRNGFLEEVTRAYSVVLA